MKAIDLNFGLLGLEDWEPGIFLLLGKLSKRDEELNNDRVAKLPRMQFCLFI